MSRDLREHILVTAVACFGRGGYRGTTIGEISRMAGVAPATVYRYFGSKAALFAALGRPELAAGAGDVRRREILGAALALFAQEGMDRSTMSRVAAAAGVSRATLYSRFGSKEALLAGVLEDGLFAPAQGRDGEESDEPAGGTEARALRMLERLQAPRLEALMQLVGAECIRLPAMTHFLSLWVERAVADLAEGMAPYCRNRRQAHRMAGLLVAQIFGLAYLGRRIPSSMLGGESVSDLAERATSNLLEGLKTGRGK